MRAEPIFDAPASFTEPEVTTSPPQSMLPSIFVEPEQCSSSQRMLPLTFKLPLT